VDDVRAHIADLRQVAAGAATEVRRIAYELRPTVLDDMGLDAAIARYAQDVEQHAGVTVIVSLSLGAERLESELETVIYRVAQEAMTNAVKHAHATHLDVSLSGSDGDVRLTVTDNGLGFDLDNAEGKGLGLLGMRERADLVGGKLSVRSEQGEGTTVELQVPRTRS
jgi:two-component system sensor histidine kinase NreB